MASLALACAQATEYHGPAASLGPAGAAGAASAAAAGSAGTAGNAHAGGGSAAGGALGTAGGAGSGGGSGLSSDVFGKGGSSGATGGSAGAVACNYSSSPGCDFARIDGCCKPLACERANGADVFNTYPVESCRALIQCVQAHPGCSSASDPLCFQNEAPDAPCLMEGYQASHTDPDGPFAWTRELINCACGYY